MYFLCYILCTTTLTTGLRRLLGGYMKIANYSVRVLNSKNNPAEESDEGYVYLRDKEQYSLLLRNFDSQDAVAMIEIDGKTVAYVKVPKKDKVQIDTSATSDKKFTFYKFNQGDEVKAVFLNTPKKDRGSVRVRFVQVDTTFQWNEVAVAGTIYWIPSRIYYPWLYNDWNPFYWDRPILTVTNGPGTTISGSSIKFNDGPSYQNSFTVSEGALGNITISNSYGGQSTGGNGGSDTVNALYCSSPGPITSGGTGMSGIAEYIPEDSDKHQKEFKKSFDAEEAVTIRLRLVCRDTQLPERPSALKGIGNPDPAPIS